MATDVNGINVGNRLASLRSTCQGYPVFTSGTIQESTCYYYAQACWALEETYYSDTNGVAVFKQMKSSTVQSYVSAANCPSTPGL